MNDLIQTVLLAAVPTIVAITLHEAAHGYAAWAMGDDTARLAGRLSLNPLAHVDRFGTIILPGLLLLSHAGFLFGWAKPVPIAAWRFRDPRRGMMVVAAAGPAMNFLLAWLALLALHLVPLLPAAALGATLGFLRYFLLANLVLALFNLLPIPPLDGGRIAVGLLPARAAAVWARLERAGLVIVLLVVFLLPTVLGHYGVAFDPVRVLLTRAMDPVLRGLTVLAGHPATLGMALLDFDG